MKIPDVASPVADVVQDHRVLFPHPCGQRHTDGHRNHGGKVTDIAVDPQRRIGIVPGPVPSARETPGPAQLLEENMPERLPLHQVRSEVAVHGKEIVPFLERKSTPDGGRFVPVARVGAADHLPLLVQTQDGIVAGTRQAQKIVQLQLVFNSSDVMASTRIPVSHAVVGS